MSEPQKTNKKPNFKIIIEDLDNHTKKSYTTSQAIMSINESKTNSLDGIDFIFGTENQVAGLTGVLLYKILKVIGKSRLETIFKVVLSWDDIQFKKLKPKGGVN